MTLQDWVMVVTVAVAVAHTLWTFYLNRKDT